VTTPVVLFDRAKIKALAEDPRPIGERPELPLQVGNETAHTPHEVVYVLTRYLAGRCDGARVHDNVGFNRIDAKLGHKLADMDFHEWTPGQLWAARKILERYKNRQLKGFWEYVPDVPEPPKPSQLAEQDRRRNEWMRQNDPTWKPEATQRRLALDTIKGQQVIVLQHTWDQRLVDAVKRLPQRIYDKDNKRWVLPMHIDTLESSLDFALEWGYEIPDDVHEACNAIWEKFSGLLELSHASKADFDIPGLGGEMFPFQRAGVQFAAQVHDVMIADEMGLGKTVQALAAIKHGNNFPAIVVCPASLKRNWEREAKKWIPGIKVAVLTSFLQPIKHFDGTPAYDLLIVNYNSKVLEKWVDRFIDFQPAAIICDEAHALKNRKAQQTQLMSHLLKETSARKIFLSGTPVVNRPMEFWQLLKMLGYDKAMGGESSYKMRYDNKDRNRLQELNSRVRTMFFVRRLKSEVLTDLPPKMRTVVPLEIDNRREYAEAEADVAGYFATRKAMDPRFLAELKTNAQLAAATLGMDVNEIIEQGVRQRYIASYAMAEQAKALLRWEALKQMAVKGKMKAVCEWIEEFMADSDQKLVLFALHTEHIEALTRKYSQKYGAVCIHGGVQVEHRMPLVDKFQNDPKCRLIIGNMHAMGEGLTLTAASNVAFIEYGWNPKTHDQAEDRCHRIGQNDSVMVWNLVAENTIDEEICLLIDEKRAVVEAIQDGAGADSQRTMMFDLQRRLEQRRSGVKPEMPSMLDPLDQEELDREIEMAEEFDREQEEYAALIRYQEEEVVA
jgi:SWI/SNF-related matrix-associated actin-dependent regulator 1 of chromatin subfamily A